MADDGAWIVIPNWDTFQHYRDRDPPWIKLHRSLAHDPDWWDLSGHRRAIVVGVWMEYASTHGRLTVDAQSLSRRLNLRVTKADVESLIHAGFIQVSASRPLAIRYQNASPEGEAEAEGERDRKKEKRKKENPTPNGQRVTTKSVRSGRPFRCTYPGCGIELGGPIALADHLSNVHWDDSLQPTNAERG